MKKFNLPSGFNVRDIFLLLVFNTLIAIFVVMVTEKKFENSIVYSQAIGICIYTFATLLIWVGQNRKALMIRLLIVIIGGIFAGMSIATLLLGKSISSIFAADQNSIITLVIGFTFGSILIVYFYSQKRYFEQNARIQQQILEQSEYQKSIVETNLKVLQAQIEPHFLFNTLSNIICLIESNPTAAKSMLEDLTSYLRASLRRTRDGQTTLGDELTLLDAYLSIHKIRMGERLAYQISCPSELRSLSFPPLLIQPLVENAIQHGLEPAARGGQIDINVTQDKSKLLICVRNPGRLKNSTGGIGLKNVRERITRIYGDSGSFNLKEHEGDIVSAEISIILP